MTPKLINPPLMPRLTEGFSPWEEIAPEQVARMRSHLKDLAGESELYCFFAHCTRLMRIGLDSTSYIADYEQQFRGEIRRIGKKYKNAAGISSLITLCSFMKQMGLLLSPEEMKWTKGVEALMKDFEGGHRWLEYITDAYYLRPLGFDYSPSILSHETEIKEYFLEKTWHQGTNPRYALDVMVFIQSMDLDIGDLKANYRDALPTFFQALSKDDDWETAMSAIVLAKKIGFDHTGFAKENKTAACKCLNALADRGRWYQFTSLAADMYELGLLTERGQRRDSPPPIGDWRELK